MSEQIKCGMHFLFFSFFETSKYIFCSNIYIWFLISKNNNWNLFMTVWGFRFYILHMPEWCIILFTQEFVMCRQVELSLWYNILIISIKYSLGQNILATLFSHVTFSATRISVMFCSNLQCQELFETDFPSFYKKWSLC